MAEKKEKQELAHLQMNAFEAYGAQMMQTSIVGKLLRFSKGDWLVGQDDEELPVGTRLVANMDQLLVGWIKWIDQRPDQQIMGLLVEGYKPPKRDTLGDTDENEWPTDAQGKPRDPWQFTNYLLMKAPGADGSDNDNVYTLTTSSKGGLGAIGKLATEYGKHMRMQPDQFPVIELDVDWYDHPVKEYGRIKIPLLDVVGWEPKEKFVREAAE